MGVSKLAVLGVVLATGALEAGRVACWRLEEKHGKYAPNSGMGNGCGLYVANHGVAPSNVVYVPSSSVAGDNWALAATGNVAQLWAWSADGVLDSTASPAALNAALTDDFTILARVQWHDSDWNNMVVSKYAGWDLPGFFLSLRDAGGGSKYVVFYVDDRAGSGTLREVLYGPDSSLSGRWVYLAAVRQRLANTNVCTLYVNGVARAVETNGVVGSLSNGAPVRLGTVGMADANAFGGAIAEVAVWDEALDGVAIAFYTNQPFYRLYASPTNAWPLKRLAVYYGYPSQVNNAMGVLHAAYATFAPYDIIVFGEGLEEPAHTDHNFTRQLIGMLVAAGKEVYGYVDLGVTTRNHSYSTLTNKMSLWRGMGATGIFLDDYGYDFGVTRERQNSAVAYAHQIGCSVCANAWNPQDVFNAAYDAQYNPQGLPPVIGSRDAYLAESFVIKEGEYDAATNWIVKSAALTHYTTQTGTRVFCLTTCKTSGDFSTSKWWYACDVAALYGFAAVGWGEPDFSATDQKLPWRPSRVLYLGTEIVQRANNAVPTNSMRTDEGWFFIDTAGQRSGFMDDVPPRVMTNVFVFPYAGCTLYAGTYEIQWRIEGVRDYGLTTQSVALTLITPEGSNYVLVEGMANRGAWTWDTSGVTTREDYQLVMRVQDAAGNTTWRTSGVFTVIIPEPVGMMWWAGCAVGVRRWWRV